MQRFAPRSYRLRSLARVRCAFNGGGIFNGATGVLTLTSSTVSGNSCGNRSHGTGIYNRGRYRTASSLTVSTASEVHRRLPSTHDATRADFQEK